MRQYVSVALKPGGKAYVYINDEPHDIAVGHTVNITTPWGTDLDVEVKEVSADRPDHVPDYLDLKPCRKV